MNSALASIGKNLILMGIVILSALNLFFGWFNFKELIGIQLLVGLAYVFLTCYEYLNASYKASLPVQRYPYFTNQFFMYRSLKIGVFLIFAVVLFGSGSRIQYIYPICILIAITEGVVTFLKYRQNLCFVNIYANYLLIASNSIAKIFASEIMIIEFRHEIFYFVKKDTKTVIIKLEHIQNRERFVQSLNEWINRNQVLVSPESKSKIKDLISF